VEGDSHRAIAIEAFPFSEIVYMLVSHVDTAFNYAKLISVRDFDGALFNPGDTLLGRIH